MNDDKSLSSRSTSHPTPDSSDPTPPPSDLASAELDPDRAWVSRERVGFSPELRARVDLSASVGAIPYRVARVDAEGCTVLGEPEPMRARVPKRLRTRTPLVVGDWVVARLRRGELEVRQRLERSTALVRRAAGSEGQAQVLAANLDWVPICMGLDRDFRLPRLERWLSLVHESGARPLVILTKAGLISPELRAAREREAAAVSLGVAVVAVDVFAGLGLDALDELLEPAQPWAASLALVGSSGVGKSTLLNFLRGEPSMATGSVSEAHGKGRHTTSHRELFELPARRLVIIDTPGLREVGVWGQGQGIDATFAEVAALGQRCRFNDCAHAGEPGCAVAAAIEAGELDPRRLESMRRLASEREATARRASAHARREDERAFARRVRASVKGKQRGGGGSRGG